MSAAVLWVRGPWGRRRWSPLRGNSWPAGRAIRRLVGGARRTYRRPPEPSRWRSLLLCLAATAVLAVPARAADGSLTLPLEHPAYELLDRLERTGHLGETGGGIRPFTRRWVATLALRAQSHDRHRHDTAAGRLTEVDRRRLARLLDELADEVEQVRGTVISPVDSARVERRSPASSAPLLTYRAPQGHLSADLLAREQVDRREGRGRREAEMTYRHKLGAVIEGRLFERVGLRLAFEQTREQGSRGYFLRGDVIERPVEAVQLKGGVADYHRGAAYVTVGFGPDVHLQAGKDQVSWGPSTEPTQNLGLSSAAPAFDMVRLQTRLGALRFVSLHGALRPCPDRPDAPVCAGEADSAASYIVNRQTRLLDRDKWIAAHRLEWAVSPRLDLGLQEVVIYADRGPQLAYLNPFMFYWAAQSYLGDRDNVMMALDADWRFRPGWRWWAAYAIDDLKKLKVFSDDFANKFSLQTGLSWADPLGVSDTDAHLDYVRIEPWIYTHKFPINTFRHFDAPLGHPLGPNSDRWRLRLEHRWSPDLSMWAAASRARHGENVLLDDGTVLNVGGDLHFGWRPGDRREEKSFLDGRLSRRDRLEGGIDWQPWPRLRLRAGGGVEWGDDVPLPPRDGSATRLQDRTGYGDGRQTEFFLDMRYGVM
jgi:hypothetical protein